jgi:hypothetical protein
MAKEAARLTAVVVLPTPPFWFAIAMILAILKPLLLSWLNRNCAAIGYYRGGNNPANIRTAKVKRN